MRKKSIFILVVILLSVIFTSYFITTRYLTPTITLDGGNPYIIDYKEEFKEPGYSGTYNKKNIIIAFSNFNVCYDCSGKLYYCVC